MTDEQPKYLTQAEVNDMVNGALKSQKKDFEKLFNSQQEQLQNVLNALQGQKPAETGPLPSKSEMTERMTKLEKDNKLLLDNLEKERADRKTATKSTALRSQLNKHGILSKVEIAEKFLADQVSFDEDGQLMMNVEEVPGVMRPVPLAEAVAKFAQTEHGKFLADPKDLRGSGGGNFNSPNRPKTLTASITQQGDVPLFTDAKALKAYVAGELGKSNLNR